MKFANSNKPCNHAYFILADRYTRVRSLLYRHFAPFYVSKLKFRGCIAGRRFHHEKNLHFTNFSYIAKRIEICNNLLLVFNLQHILFSSRIYVDVALIFTHIRGERRVILFEKDRKILWSFFEYPRHDESMQRHRYMHAACCAMHFSLTSRPLGGCHLVPGCNYLTK